MTPSLRTLSAPRRYRLGSLAGAALILMLGVGVYFNSLPAPFVFDDLLAILDNTTILNLNDVSTVLSPPGKGNTVQARPLLNLSFALNHAVGGLSPRGFRVVNIGIHLLTALTFFGVLRRTFSASCPGISPPMRLPLALIISLLWTLHPLNTGAVTYIAQRAEALMALCFMLTLYTFIRSTQAVPPTSNRWAAGAVLSSALGMGCKEIMVTAPLLVLLYDRIFVASSWRVLWRQRRTLHGLLAATWLVFLAVESQLGGSRDNVDTGFGGLHASWRYLLTQSGVITHYLRLAFWPDTLCIDYYGWPLATGIADVWPTFLLLAALVCATLAALIYTPRLGFLGAWFFVILAPTSSLMPIADRAAEHRLYLPLMALATLAGLVVLAAGRVLTVSARLAPGPDRRSPELLILGVAAILMLVPLGSRTLWRNWDYRSNLSLWLTTLEARPHNPRALMNVGAIYGSAGFSEMSIRYLNQAIDTDPTYAPAVLRSNLAAARMRQGQFHEALTDLEAALAMNPRDAGSWYNRGICYSHLGDHQATRESLQRAIDCDPKLALAQLKLAELNLQTGNWREALTCLDAAAAARPDMHEVYAERARVWMLLGDAARAREDVERCRQHGGVAASTVTDWLTQSAAPGP